MYQVNQLDDYITYILHISCDTGPIVGRTPSLDNAPIVSHQSALDVIFSDVIFAKSCHWAYSKLCVFLNFLDVY